jgi:hypothetical protein
MHRIVSVRRLLGAAGAALSLVAALPAAVQAAAPIHANFSGTFTNVDFGCGILVTVTNRGVENFTPYDANGSYRDIFQFNSTLTAANGKSVQLSAAGQSIVHVVTNADGTQTSTLTVNGVPERISSTHGSILTRDAGRITVIDTFDSSGTVISETITLSGPHPEVNSGFTLFCQTIVAALS